MWFTFHFGNPDQIDKTITVVWDRQTVLKTMI